MTVREKMKQTRLDMHMTFKDMSRLSGASPLLLERIEEGFVTHPDIARRVGSAYGLTEQETEELMPEIHRRSSPNYDPNKYVLEPEYNDKGVLIKLTLDEQNMLNRNESGGHLGSRKKGEALWKSE